MLSNSFSNIPICIESDSEKKWVFLTDSQIMRFLRLPTDQCARKNRLSMQIGDALKDHGLTAESATDCGPCDLIIDVVPRMGNLPVLVSENERLVGIISAFDLL
jgi:hypothetical protein